MPALSALHYARRLRGSCASGGLLTFVAIVDRRIYGLGKHKKKKKKNLVRYFYSGKEKAVVGNNQEAVGKHL